MASMTLRLRQEGVADSLRTREWMLGRLLDEVISAQLTSLRPAVPGAASSDQGRASELAQLRADFQFGSPTLEAWSALYHRYVAINPLSMHELAQLLGMVERTLQRRLNQGQELLAEALREAELKAIKSLGEGRGEPASQRILTDPTAAGHDVDAVKAALRAVVRNEARVAQLPAQALEEAGRRPPSDLADYRLGRIAEWSQARYALDERFVELGLIVDRGEEAAGGRWAVSEQRFSNLRDVLAAEASPALVVLGPPGSGKSTLLRRLELDTAVDGLRGEASAVTFFVPLNAYRPAPSTPSISPRVWLAERWAAQYPHLPPLESLLDAGSVLFLLDALNEMPHRDGVEYRQRVMAWKAFVQTMAEERPGCRVVFSCRSLDYSAPISTPTLSVPQVTIEPLGDDRIRLLLAAYAPGRADTMWDRLVGTPQLELIRTPYFLRLFVEAFDGAELPVDRGALITEFVRRALRQELERDNPLFQPDALLSERDYERTLAAKRWRSPHELPERGRLFPKLADLAFGMQVTQASIEAAQVRTDYDQALAILGDERGGEIVRAAEALAILDEDRDRDEVLFRHQLLQEYFAARKLARDPQPELVAAPWRAAEIVPGLRELMTTLPPGESLPALTPTGWEETMVLGAAMAAEPESFVAALMPHNLVVASRAANEPLVRPKLSESFLSDLRLTLIARCRAPEADLRARIAAGLVLGWMGDPRFETCRGVFGRYLRPPMVSLPGGTYPIGGNEPIYDAETNLDQRSHMPAHTVRLAPFEIGRFAVTNAEFGCFLAAGGYDDERWWDTPAAKAWRRGEGTAEGSKRVTRTVLRTLQSTPTLLDRWHGSGQMNDALFSLWERRMRMTEDEFEAHLTEEFPPRRVLEPRYWRDERFNNPSQPVVGVSWHEARAYCAWLTAQDGRIYRLPSEVEREAAARGTSGRPYAFGDTYDRLKGLTLETHLRCPCPVGVAPEGDDPEGVCDLSGNTADWTISLWGAHLDTPDFGYPYNADDGREDVAAGDDVQRIVRGGSWMIHPNYAQSAFRNENFPTYRGTANGFRLAASLD